MDLRKVLAERGLLWHPTRNDGLNPEEVLPGSRKRLWFQCDRGHEWKAPAYSIKSGTGCPYCSGRNAIPGETDLATTHPHLMAFWSEKNTLVPSQVMAGTHKKAWWVCAQGHEWEALIVSVATDGCGCPYCTGKRAIPGETDLATLRPDLMEQWDSEKNTLDPAGITLASHDKVWWRCALGHSWQSVVFSRTRKNAAGCPYCTGRLVLAGFNDLETLKPKLAQEWYQPLNGTLRPEDVTLGSNKKVWWQCSEGHVWQAYIYARTKPKGTGCPVCAGHTKPRSRNAAAAKKARPLSVAAERPGRVHA